MWASGDTVKMHHYYSLETGSEAGIKHRRTRMHANKLARWLLASNWYFSNYNVPCVCARAVCHGQERGEQTLSAKKGSVCILL